MGTIAYTDLYGATLTENRDGVTRGYVHDPPGNTLALLDTNQIDARETLAGAAVVSVHASGNGALEAACRSVAPATLFSSIPVAAPTPKRILFERWRAGGGPAVFRAQLTPYWSVALVGSVALPRGTVDRATTYTSRGERVAWIARAITPDAMRAFARSLIRWIGPRYHAAYVPGAGDLHRHMRTLGWLPDPRPAVMSRPLPPPLVTQVRWLPGERAVSFYCGGALRTVAVPRPP